MQLSTYAFVIYLAHSSQLKSVLSCSPSYVPEIDDEDLDIYLNTPPRLQTIDCECGKQRNVATRNVTFDYSWIVKIDSAHGPVSHSCWGSIVNDLLIVTSAKCLVHYNALNVKDDLLTTTKFQGLKLTSQATPTLNLIPKVVHCHPRAIPTYMTQRVIDYDICIIELSERIDFSGYDVSPVCIPESKALSKQLVGQKSVIFGLHKTQHLRDVEIRSHSRIYDMKYCGRENNRNLCTQFWKSSPDMYNFDYIGSPLMISMKSGQMLQVGVPSDNDFREKGQQLTITSTPVQFSTNLVNEEILSFINKIAGTTKAGWCKCSIELYETYNFDQQPKPSSSKHPWDGFPHEHTKTSSHCNIPLGLLACGVRRSVGPLSRIVGGDEAGRHEYPWQGQVLYENNPHNPSDKSLCGGTLINTKMILTAAHCLAQLGGSEASIANPSKVAVRLRRHEGFTFNDSDTVDVSVKNVFVHPDFVSYTDFRGDIALLELNTSVEFSIESKLSPVCLPTEGEFGLDNAKLVGKHAIVIGWGITDADDKSALASTLQELRVPILKSESCNDVMRVGKLPPHAICATHLNIPANYMDPSHGDSGGPLMVEHYSKSMVQVGIVSAGTYDGAGPRDNPVVFYTSVADYLPFVDYFSFAAGAVWCDR